MTPFRGLPHNTRFNRWSLIRVRIVGLSLLAFLLMFSYSIARPASESLFLEAYGSVALPYVWAVVAAAALATVAIYNRLVAGRELVGLFGGAAAVSAALLVGLQLGRRAGAPGIPFALYVWKDVYIVVLVEIFYSFANAVFPIRTARWAYGFFGAIGMIGGILGNLVVGALAARIGTGATLWLILPLLGLSWLACIVLSRVSGHRGGTAAAGREGPGILSGLKIVRRSQYLLLVLVLIAIVQVAITFIDLLFNQVIEQTYLDTDQRTAVIGQVYAVISAGAMGLHALTGPILRLAGVPITLVAIPLLLSGALAGFLVLPAFATVAAAKVASKCLDYTLFRAGKEILYIPLSYEEKTQGKAVVDMLTYRVAKGGASLLLLALAAVKMAGVVAAVTLALIAGWLGLTLVIVRRFRRRVSRAREMASAR